MSYLDGQVLGRHQCSDLMLTELRYDGPRRAPRHSHKLAFFRLLLDGDCTERCGPSTIAYSPFTVLFHPAGVEHQDDIGPDGAHFFTIELGDEWLRRIGHHRLATTPLVDERGGDLLWLSLHVYREYARLPNAFAEFAMEGFVLEMLAIAARSYATIGDYRGPRWFQGVLAQLHGGFSGDMTLNALAESASIHPVHLSRVFQKFTGRTFGEYLQRLRVQFACQKLCHPGAALSQIAIAAGFSDQSHFTHVFKEVAGMTPGVFRNLLPDPDPGRGDTVSPQSNGSSPRNQADSPHSVVSCVPTTLRF